MDFATYLKDYKPKPLGERRSYAVLLPLIWEQESQEWLVLYQVRSEMISQLGEVSFPGGAVEEGESFEVAAIRETVEELNLKAEQVTILGEIDYLVSNHRTIHCFIGQLAIEDWQILEPNEEVARLFTIPLKELLAHPPKYYRLATEVQATQDFPFDRIRNGKDYDFSHIDHRIPFYDITDENIWGMTAQFTHRFTEILKEGNKKA